MSSSKGGSSQPNNPPTKKRKLDNNGNKSAARRVARAIPAQLPEVAFENGELNLQPFVAAHEFEIRALEQSMAISKTQGATRAFQKVPRGLRRRAASHNPKRVPKRLRARAQKEKAEDNTPLVTARRRKPTTTTARIRMETAKKLRTLAFRKKTFREKRARAAGARAETLPDKAKQPQRARRPKIRRNALNEPPRPRGRFRKRQKNKIWLPTHMWHAKRARMMSPKEPLWRFAMPLRPNEKIYRPTHRMQGDRGAVVWDMSYMSTIGLYGHPAGMERVLKRIGVTHDSCWNDKGKKWRAGTRSWSGMLSRETKQGRRQSCPATIFWNPAPADRVAVEDLKKDRRQVFLRVHPASFSELFNELLRWCKSETPQLYIEDLRFEIGSIELTGPASTEVLHSVLTPYPVAGEPKSKHAELFASLKGLTNPAALPQNVILGFSIQDPRLRYPPRKQSPAQGEAADMKLLETVSGWPAETALKPYALLDREARHEASQLPTQGLVNRRRSKITPGSFLKPSPIDPAIPIVLLASRSGSSTQAQGKWTLLAPWKCIQPIWYSIVHCPLSTGGNPRFAGLEQTRQVAFERGLPWFPADFPTTDAGVAWELDQRAVRTLKWSRRPKSKRTEWSTVDLGAGRKGELGDGLACDFEYLFGLPRPDDAETQSTEGAMDVEQGQVSQTTATSSSALSALHHVSRKAFLGLARAGEGTALSIPLNALLTVRIRLVTRGTVGPCARIYRLPATPPPVPVASDAEVPATIPPSASTSFPSALPHDLRAQWLAKLPDSTAAGAKDTTRQPRATTPESRRQRIVRELTSKPTPWPSTKSNLRDIGGQHPLCPSSNDLIGFVTTGEFCLSDGRGSAIGSIAVDMVLGGFRADETEGRLCIVRSAGENVGWLARWEAV
ncbi:ribonucleases P/MRP protein subunit POP1-domain-containing protein [Emericellopsis atlantica]|uniref:Ribonucleases P/MRP protein subunit POP1-domain-containing protein n=1 Tax=Emericellopsis atlantica TaxID=2614577 RepID=A0A9P7ZVU2_9HYPO|nr:ribonucleases P/MRP protein subunit POP1-domain-containing protein [Emericellopsis atlantica]KAG9258662.1 ribonucleases P/MRP protein subunit POP1-domain-containing protein [Emericellopsis atlantica]